MIATTMGITDTMKDCLVIGRSPFVNKVDWSRIDFNKYFVICINYPVPDIPVDIVVARDDAPNPVLAPATKFISPKTNYNFVEKATESNDIEFCCYTSSSGVYIAFKMGFKRVFLIGIDHVEDDKPFIHYDGIVNNGVATSLSNRLCKNYICQYKSKMDIYQTNPTVKEQWDLPFLDIATLYD